jgi:ABC-2 type transport system ATP-binding protein
MGMEAEGPYEKGRDAVYGRGISKSFGQITVLNDLAIDIPKGVIYCLLGPNGSGKTTLIRSLMGLVRLDAGRVYVLGEPLEKVSRVYSRMGYMPQQRPLYPDLTVQENLEFYAGLYGIRGKKRVDRISEVLSVVDLEETRDRITGNLSGGMYQRISLACTLVHDPELLLLDEPTVGIDPVTKQSFWEYFKHLTAKDGRTIIITTHIMEEADRCDIVGFMRAGKMMAESSPDELKKLAGLQTFLRLKVAEPEKDAARLRDLGFGVEQEGETLMVLLPDPESLRDVLSCQGLRPLSYKIIEPTLEQAFLKLAI